MSTPVNQAPAAPVVTVPAERINFMYALMKAVGNDQDSMSLMQVTDAKTTMNAVNLEQMLYTQWNKVLQNDALAIQGVDPKSDNASSIIQQLQSQYNVDSSKAQTEESQQDGATQSAQGQTSTDASNLQMKAQMVQGVNSIQSALTNMLGNIIS